MSTVCASARLCAQRRRPPPQPRAAARCAAPPSANVPAASGAHPSGSGPLAWFVATRDNVKHSFALAGRASAAALVANMLGDVPPGVRAQAGRETRAHLADLMYGGDAERMDADMRFHRDGFTLLARDLTKDGHLLFRSEADLTSRQLAVRRRIQGDSRALLPFLLLVMNTFPLTMAILEPLLQRGLPRHWVLPSCFEDSRLRLIERARKLSTRNAAR